MTKYRSPYTPRIANDNVRMVERHIGMHLFEKMDVPASKRTTDLYIEKRAGIITAGLLPMHRYHG